VSYIHCSRDVTFVLKAMAIVFDLGTLQLLPRIIANLGRH
jgi:hypothetical protein